MAASHPHPRSFSLGGRRRKDMRRTSMGTDVFRAENATYSYTANSSPVLRDISMAISDGERVAILGANASGKSTLLHLLDGLYFSDSGRIEAFGVELTEDSVE